MYQSLWRTGSMLNLKLVKRDYYHYILIAVCIGCLSGYRPDYRTANQGRSRPTAIGPEAAGLCEKLGGVFFEHRCDKHIIRNGYNGIFRTCRLFWDMAVVDGGYDCGRSVCSAGICETDMAADVYIRAAAHAA